MNCNKFKLPAYLYDFSTLDDGRTIAKLKVFYIGETEDGRIIDSDMAEKLKSSLPYCPVVAFYSDVKDDFIGHNSTQYIYGLVQPTANYDFEECEDGKTWLITEVMLYTDRIDNIGSIANKIIGKKQSLEMDPKTAKYSIFRENGRTKIRFTDGRLVGLSVLGDSQKPAFTGSEFFAANDFSDMREKFENFFSCLEEESRGEPMNNFKDLADFIELSYTEKMQLASSEIRKNLGDDFCFYIVDMNDEWIVCHVYNFEEEKNYFLKFYYTCNEDLFTLNSSDKVYAKYLTKEEVDYLEGYSNNVSAECGEDENKDKEPEEVQCVQEKEQKDEDTQCAEPCKKDEDGKCAEEPCKKEECAKEPCKKEECVTEEPKEDSDNKEETDCIVEKDKKTECVEEKEEKEEGVNEDDEEDKSSEDKDEKQDEDFSKCCSSPLSDSERIELENYRRKDRIALVQSFESLLPKEVLLSFEERIDEYDYAKLETELAIKYTKYSIENKENNSIVNNASVPFSFGKVEEQQEEPGSYKELVARRLRK